MSDSDEENDVNVMDMDASKTDISYNDSMGATEDDTGQLPGTMVI